MSADKFTAGKGRTKVTLTSAAMGDDLVVFMFNEMAHIGAVAVGEYDFDHNRASVSVITRLGHKDDAIACKAAHEISRSLKRAVCVVAGIHLDNILAEEIQEIVANSEVVVKKYISSKQA